VCLEHHEKSMPSLNSYIFQTINKIREEHSASHVPIWCKTAYPSINLALTFVVNLQQNSAINTNACRCALCSYHQIDFVHNNIDIK
jgi:hypothetical protein